MYQLDHGKWQCDVDYFINKFKKWYMMSIIVYVLQFKRLKPENHFVLNAVIFFVWIFSIILTIMKFTVMHNSHVMNLFDCDACTFVDYHRWYFVCLNIRYTILGEEHIHCHPPDASTARTICAVCNQVFAQNWTHFRVLFGFWFTSLVYVSGSFLLYFCFALCISFLLCFCVLLVFLFA